jgi:hypothetical protein
MAKQKKKTISQGAEPLQPAEPQAPSLLKQLAKPWLVWPMFALATLVFYWTPLFDDAASIQWDAVDVHYSAQKYFAQSIEQHHLPVWTPFEFSGMPFMADPQTAAWYPLHWPFFLFGITPRSIEWELALHAFLALGGMFLLARRLTGSTGAAILAAVLYGWSGFFAEHSSHVGIFETAALAPWLLWAGLRALEPDGRKYFFAAGAIGGGIALVGHFQTSLYSFSALALLVLAAAATRRAERLWPRVAALLAITAALTLMISAIQVLPGLELTANSVRAGLNSHQGTNAPLVFAALATLIMPDFYGVLSGQYTGPVDITQFYFYGGLLLLPLVAAAFMARKQIWIPLALIVPAIWYGFGPGAGLYSVVTLLPGFRSVRAPVHVWFVAAMGLALMASIGGAWVQQRFRRSWIVAALILFSAVDLWHSNMSANPLAYGRASYAVLYGNTFESFQAHLKGIKSRPLYRIWAPADSPVFGPLNGSLDAGTEVTYGYNPLELSRYADYLDAANSNPKLLNGLAVTNKVDMKRSAIDVNPDHLARISAAPQVRFASSPEAARAALNTLDPAESAVVEAPEQALPPLAREKAAAEVAEYRGDFYRVRYSTPTECLLRIAVPFFPGWEASVDGKAVNVLAVDYALSGVIVPAGEHELTFQFHSNWLTLGAMLSLLGVAICIAGIKFVH